MIFAAYGHPLDQQKIVEATFGALVCRPSGPTATITQDLSRSWTDDSGTDFDSRVDAAFDAYNGINAISNSFVIDQLSNNNPILYANTHHAMVCVEVDYIQTPSGPTVTAVGVLDPYPGIPDFHPLSVAEMTPAQLGGQMTYLAAVVIS